MNRVAVVLLAALACAGCARDGRGVAPLVVLSEVRYQEGDDPRWAAPEAPDSAWIPMRFWDVHGGDGIYWLRSAFELEPRHRVPGRPLAIQFVGMATAEIFWDGVRLPTAGVVGATAAEERPGPIQMTIHVPDSLASFGPHLVALRLSSHHRGFEPVSAFWQLLVGDYRRLVSFQPVYAATALLSLSGLLVAGLFFLALFAFDRSDRTPLWLGLLGLTAAALLVAESWRPLFGYTYDWQLPRLRAVAALTYAVNLLILVAVTAMFPRRGGGLVRAAGALLLTLPMFLSAGWDPKQVGMFEIGLVGAMLWCGFAAVRRMPGAIAATLALVGTVAVSAFRPAQFVDQTFFLVMDVLMAGLLVAQALRLRQARREREAARLRSARLETELLRRHIQPHFLMNSLTALGDWIEEDPKVASRMIHALAEEFRTLSAVADRRLIRVEEEIRLCRSHVEVMSLRRGSEIRLETRGLIPDATIPPAVFHTLVENAITHAPNGASMTLSLSREDEGGGIRYVFEAPARPGAAPGPEGTGLRYVRARLQEAWGDGWTLSRDSDGACYRTVLTLPGGER